MEQLERKFDLSLPQQDIYFEQILYPSSPIYNIGARIEINGTLDIQLLQQAYRHLVDQHDTLRMVLDVSTAVPSFEIRSSHNLELEYRDFSDWENADKAAHQFMENTFSVPFDLKKPAWLHKSFLLKISDRLHYLFSVYHHIITDGWGTSLLFQRVVEYYNALFVKADLPLAPVYRYTDFIQDDLNYQASADYLADAAYWKDTFEHLPDALLPLIGEKANKSSTSKLTIRRSVYDNINKLAADADVSAFHILLGCMYTYFARYYSCNDVTIGIPVLNRSKTAYKKTVGLFMGVTPLRIVVDAESCFQELVQSIRQKLRKDYRHQRFPLGKLVQALNIFDETERLFNISLSYEKQDYSAAFAETDTRVIPLSHRSERGALAMYVREFDESEDVIIDFEYNLSYYTSQEITQLLERVDNIINSVIAAPSQKIKDINFLSAYDVRIAEKDLNKHTDYPSAKTIIDLFHEQLSRAPEKIAVRDSEKTLTYQELDEEANRVAFYLQQHADLAPKSPVAVLMNRSASLLAVLLGVMKGGHSYIPLDPDFPETRLKYIVANSQCSCVIIDDELSDRCMFTHIMNLRTSSFSQQMIVGKIEEMPVPDDTAYIIYTSGSTGNPKGVEIGHRSLVNFLWSMKDRPGIEMSDVFYALTTYSFDISILEFFLPVVSGAEVFIASRELLSDPAVLINSLEKIIPTIIQATPGFYQMLLNAGWKGDQRLKVLCGGDLLSEALAGKLLTSSKELWNMYGPTETTIWSGTKQIRKMQEADNIGCAINNTSFFLLDEWLNAVPVGAVGNIYIGGDGLAKGYYLNSDLTREKFIQRGRRLYNTGDLGKWNEEGEIIFLGRADTQVKIRGYRIETAEIEKQLIEHNTVKEAVVVARKVDDIAMLVAYVKTGPVFDADELFAFLEKRLPAYMIPSAIIPTEVFPLTPNNKIDRKALSNRSVNVVNSTVSFRPAEDEVEKMIVEVWKKHVGLQEIGVDDNFFKIGGHSLSAVRVIYALNEIYTCSLTQADIFRHPTVAALANVIKEQKALVSTDAIERTPEAPFYDITYVQHTMWVLSQQEEASIAYNMHGAYEIQGSYHIIYMREALKVLLSRHEGLRTNFVEIEGTIKQVIRNMEDLRFDIDFTRLKEGEGPEDVFDAVFYSAFDLERDVLIRLHVVEISPEKTVLLFATHHIVMDAWSIEIFIREFTGIYAQLLEGGDYTLPEVSLQFRDYATWLNRQQEDDMAEKYWKQVLSGYEPKDTFRRLKNNNGRSLQGAKRCFSLGEHTTRQLQQLATNEKVTTFTLLVAILGAFIHKYSGHNDICVGIATSGRLRKEVQSIIGMFVNTVPVRVTVAGGAFKEVVKTVNKHMTDVRQYASYPVAKQYTGYSQPFDVMVAYQNPDFSLSDIAAFLQPYSYDHKYSRFAFTFNFYHDGNAGIICEIEYNTAAYEELMIEHLVLKFRQLLEKVLTDADLSLDEYDMYGNDIASLKQDVEIEFNF